MLFWICGIVSRYGPVGRIDWSWIIRQSCHNCAGLGIDSIQWLVFHSGSSEGLEPAVIMEGCRIDSRAMKKRPLRRPKIGKFVSLIAGGYHDKDVLTSFPPRPGFVDSFPGIMLLDRSERSWLLQPSCSSRPIRSRHASVGARGDSEHLVFPHVGPLGFLHFLDKNEVLVSIFTPWEIVVTDNSIQSRLQEPKEVAKRFRQRIRIKKRGTPRTAVMY